MPADGKSFAGWYDENGKLLSKDIEYTFTAASQSLYALFGGDVFCDLNEDDWYLEATLESVERGLITGMTSVTFAGEAPFSRAMAATVLSRVDGTDVSNVPDYGFADVKESDWFSGAVNCAAAAGVGIVSGRKGQ